MKEYNGWLTSPNILKRSLAVWGHFFVGYFIIGGSLAILSLILLAIIG